MTTMHESAHGPEDLTTYSLKEIERTICEDDSTAELGVHLSMRGGRVFVQGGVACAQRRDRVLAIVREHCGDVPVIDELTVTEDALAHAPDHREEIT